MNYVYCAHREYSFNVFKKLKRKYKNFTLIDNKKKLTLSRLKKINPEFIFFPDWSWFVPEEIIKNFNCICIHESDLPKFRGGSPLQNQIIRGVKKSKSTAFLMNEKLDSGKIISKKSLSLEGSLDEIFLRMEKNNLELITNIISKKFKLSSQKGTPTYYKRRIPSQSELKDLNKSKLYMHNFIRMLADPYPNAYIKIGKKKIIFKTSKFDGKKLSFEGVIE